MGKKKEATDFIQQQEEWRVESMAEGDGGKNYAGIAAALSVVQHAIWNAQGDLTEPYEFKGVDFLLSAIQAKCNEYENQEKRHRLFELDPNEFQRVDNLRYQAVCEFDKALKAAIDKPSRPGLKVAA